MPRPAICWARHRRGDASQWKQALDSASYWDLVDKARTARQEDRLDDAAELLEQALQIDAREPTAALELGRAYVDLQFPQDAERAYSRNVLAREPGNLPALQGLVGVLGIHGTAVVKPWIRIDSLSPELRERIDVGRLRAERSIAQGREADSRGDLDEARSYFEDAVSQSPNDPWLRLELARLLQRMDRHAEAVEVTDALLAGEPQPEALYVAALVRAEQQDWAGALELADRIPKASRTSDMKALQARPRRQAGLAQAQALAQRGEQTQARAMLAPLVDLAGADAGSVSAIAAVYADVGDSVRARALLREALALLSASLRRGCCCSMRACCSPARRLRRRLCQRHAKPARHAPGCRAAPTARGLAARAWAAPGGGTAAARRAGTGL